MKNVEVMILDTTLRDGAQSLPVHQQFPEGSKAEIANHIASLGVQVIEAGFPVASHDSEEVAEVARTVGHTNYTVKTWGDDNRSSVSREPEIAGLTRAVPEDIEVTWSAINQAVRPRIHTFIPTDAEHMRAKFPGKSPDEIFEIGRSAVQIARSFTDEHQNAQVEFSAEAATTTDHQFLERVVKSAIQEGAHIVNVPDTVGQRDPFWMYEFYGKVIDWVMNSDPSVTISAHNHNDLDQSTANTVALVRAAAQYAHQHDASVKVQLETTVAGLGERAGNADIFPVVGNLFKFAPDMQAPVTWQFNPERAVSVAQTVMRFVNSEVHRQSPIVGYDTKVHRSGIHSDGVIKGGHRIYTPHDPTFWGHDTDAVHEEGKYQGRAGRSQVA